MPENLVWKIVYKLLSGNSLPVTKTPIFTASPFLLEFYSTFSNLYIDGNTIMLLKIPKLNPENFFSVFPL